MTTVSGILRDAKGTALPGVAVTLRYVPQVIGYAGGAVAQNNLTYLTNSTGLLSMPGLVAGPYDLSIAMPIGTSASVTAAVTARIVVNGETAQTLEDALQTTIGEITPTILSQAIAAAEAAAASAAAAALFDPDNFQPIDATLTSIAALGTAPGKIAYTTGVDKWAEAVITAAGRALLDDTDAAAQRATLGLGAAATAGFLDEDDFASNSAAAAPSQQSTKAYADAGDAATAAKGIGVGQTWQDVKASRVVGTSYRNITGKPIMVSIRADSTGSHQVSQDAVTWINVGYSPGSSEQHNSFIVPAGHYYRVATPAGTIRDWSELR